MKLTLRQRQILDLIRTHLEATGFPPTRAEIAAALGFRSANAAEEHLRALARKGAIELLKGTSRGIRLLQPQPGESLPVIGRVAAGSPILAEEHIEERYSVDPRLFHPRADYLLRVQGMSMQGAGILDADLLAVHSCREAENGRIVVARLEDEVTVKRLQLDAGRPYFVRLLPENPDFSPIDVDLRSQELVIEGLGVGLLRGDRGFLKIGSG
ncbi:MAG: transcriptional repressor LexA [Chromatiaceae bacterium]|nr:transcriptional repressor LexA [Gammaproteobacteria bacterium]MCB1873707.1 transcriptional repressor LexA [Gammaproteobacteria bacterium]MCB1880811.1 transcriptional repressor LexA [Gammaproteobacteria bacterium]MCB1905188.1 transcriptional repressor LexA [Gammaproteobacteria bacterium]MCP5447967.1 transcriptional repressor LexA [Chromatiaceae bacterium]